MIDSLTPPTAALEGAAALLDRHPAPAVQIRGQIPQAPFLAEEPDEADEPCDPRHFTPRWWPAPQAD